ncbi:MULTISPECIES: hypothetical protein [Bacteroides]|jgi:hypothetical protein|uniref:hypothetical protein n=1 Tax=Bacteroides TaxID=816 RepID=UPI00189F7B65|nr:MULTISPECIES: hypothetical protein [Bacteroides]MBV3811655.1 hypothetical protein [Bacteroides stercoris]MBV3838292.1 hypothetical protein [Bacteroides xylanisolvens]MDC2205451.1 hypothetical protein [Bacteroides thetaiotaomicron]DAT79031.1 MAG TPA: hypothetical protein [Caudoviricetes sp.]
MGTVAKSSITLVSISDAYSLSLTPNSCVIKADFDGSNPKLEHAYTIISAYCGDEKTPIEIDSSTIIKSNDNIECQLIKVDSYRYRLSIISLPVDILQGYIEIPVLSGVSAGLTGRFTFSIVRESTMLDWIQDWENNKTTIGSSYVITPKIFVGKKIIGSHDSLEDVPGLTGVYIGPSENNGAGIYGYKDNKEIFHIDQTGGKIGGWDITSGGIQCEDGTLSIKSEGAISAQSEGIIHWSLNKDGSASFANGNVTMDVEGNASFKGTIETSGGSIAGWTIGVDSIYNGTIGINSLKKFIAIANVTSVQDTGDQLDWVKEYGGVAMYYINNADYGLIGYKNNEKVFSAGADNFIAGWHFDENAIWLGTKNNNINQHTSTEGDITIGTNGLRGFKWRLEGDGSGVLAGGNITWDTQGNTSITGKITATSGSIGGFDIGDGRIGVTESIEMDGRYQGLTILSSFIKYSSGEVWTGFGTNVFPASSGLSGLCRLEYSGNTYNSGIGLLVKFRPKDNNSWYIQQAINYDGNIFGIGGKAEFEDTYIGAAYTDIIQSLFDRTHTFIFTDIGLEFMTIELPSNTQIQNAVSSKDVTFEIRIIVAHNSGNRIRVRGVSGTPLLDNDCNYVNGDNGYLDMARGDTMILRYCQNHYYLVEYRT